MAIRINPSMNIDALIKAAKSLDQLAETQSLRTQAWAKLAKDSREGATKEEVRIRRAKLDSSLVIDFGQAIRELREALNAKA
ncbi:MAG: hypothetical protein GQ468_02860 [Candidatus Scalindua sp.]|nr:hypothetical protein [Candidatus Scalindua sp.]